MIRLEETDLQVIRFGERPSDHFYCLVDSQTAPDGLDPEKMKLADPRAFDRELKRMGCLVMLTGEEINELKRRGELQNNDLHRGIHELSVREGLLDSD